MYYNLQILCCELPEWVARTFLRLGVYNSPYKNTEAEAHAILEAGGGIAVDIARRVDIVEEFFAVSCTRRTQPPVVC